MRGSRVAMAEVVEGNCHAADGGRGTQESAWPDHAPISRPAHRGELEGWQEKMRRNTWVLLPGKPIGTFAACSRVAGTTTPFTMPQLDRITSRRSWEMRVQHEGSSRTHKRAYANLATTTPPRMYRTRMGLLDTVVRVVVCHDPSSHSPFSPHHRYRPGMA